MANFAMKLRSTLIFVAIAIFALGIITFFRFIIEFSSIDKYGIGDSQEIKKFLIGQWLQQLSYLIGDVSQSLLCLFAAYFIKPFGDKND